MSKAEKRKDAEKNKFPSDKRNKIFHMIADKIAVDSFRRLARHLDFTTTEIKDMEVQSAECHTRTIVLLGIFESKQRSVKRLLKVLDLIGLKDLSNDINDYLNN